MRPFPSKSPPLLLFLFRNTLGRFHSSQSFYGPWGLEPPPYPRACPCPFRKFPFLPKRWPPSPPFLFIGAWTPCLLTPPPPPLLLLRFRFRRPFPPLSFFFLGHRQESPPPKKKTELFFSSGFLARPFFSPKNLTSDRPQIFFFFPEKMVSLFS